MGSYFFRMTLKFSFCVSVNGFFAHDQVVQNVFMLPVVSIDAKLTLGSFFPVISLHQKWEGKIKSKINAREQWSAQLVCVCTHASSCKRWQLSAMKFKEMADKNGAYHSSPTVMELSIIRGKWLTTELKPGLYLIPA